jgi:hypothetical protein
MVKALAKDFAAEHPDTGKSYMEILSDMLLQLVMYGQVKLLPNPDGKAAMLKISPKDWLEMVHWLYNRIEGTPRQEISTEVAHSIFFNADDTLFEEEPEDEVGRDGELHGQAEGVPASPQEP